MNTTWHLIKDSFYSRLYRRLGFYKDREDRHNLVEWSFDDVVTIAISVDKFLYKGNKCFLDGRDNE